VRERKEGPELSLVEKNPLCALDLLLQEIVATEVLDDLCYVGPAAARRPEHGAIQFLKKHGLGVASELSAHVAAQVPKQPRDDTRTGTIHANDDHRPFGFQTHNHLLSLVLPR
jgi:hypothetical protein